MVLWFLILGLAGGPLVAEDTHADADRPVELGAIGWHRDFADAAALAGTVSRPLMVLFQEIPGCHTCVTYGRDVLSHPLIVEAAETAFVPVAVYNNLEGPDARTLKSFGEPAWNNPVVRIITPDRQSLARRVAEDYTVAGLAAAMVEALSRKYDNAPTYIRLLAEEEASRGRGLETAVLAMHCFWEGEVVFGGMEGVVETRPGFIGQDEVVEVKFDPSLIGFRKLIARSRELECADTVYARDASQLSRARAVVGDRAVRSDEAVRPDKAPKYYLGRTNYRHVPMTSLQALKVNAALGRGGDPASFLSPRQRALHETVSRRKGEVPVVIGMPIIEAWEKVTASAGASGQSSR